MHWFDSVRERWQAIWRAPPDHEPRADPATVVAELPIAHATEPRSPQPFETPPEPVSLELLADRLLGDEQIRGALTDDEFQPLLDWALDALDRVNARGHVGAVEVATVSVREILTIVNNAFADGAPDTTTLPERLVSLRDAIGPPLVAPQRVDEARKRIVAAIGSLQGRETPPSGPEISETVARALRSLDDRETEAQA